MKTLLGKNILHILKKFHINRTFLAAVVIQLTFIYLKKLNGFFRHVSHCPSFPSQLTFLFSNMWGIFIKKIKKNWRPLPETPIDSYV